MPMTVQHPGAERKFGRDVSVSYVFAAATDYSGGNGTAKIAGVANFQIVIQRILLNVTTDNAATQTFQSSDASQVIAGSKASPGIGPITFDFGEDGFVISDGLSFNHKMSGAGMAGSVTVQAYMRPTPDLAAGIVANVAGTRGKTF